jgi:hypothetical protein
MKRPKGAHAHFATRRILIGSRTHTAQAPNTTTRNTEMAILAADCPRCGIQHTTFDVLRTHLLRKAHGWQCWYEAFCVCRHCLQSTVFVLSQDADSHPQTFDEIDPETLEGSANRLLNVERSITVKDRVKHSPPDHLPEDIARAFNEASTCMAVECWNAAGTMFRLCVDLTVKPMWPEGAPDNLKRAPLGPRLNWLFTNGHLPAALESLSSCIKDDGNDGAHEGTLTKIDAEDLLDFTTQLLEEIFTTPTKLELAKKRRTNRRSPRVQTAE